MAWTVEKVDQFYLGSLARHATAGEESGWAALSEVSDTDIGLAISTSPDAVSFSEPVERLYLGAFGRYADAVDPNGNFDTGPQSGYWVNVNALRQGLSVTDLAEAFVVSAEFQAFYGTAEVSAALISAFYANVLDRGASGQEIVDWQNSGLSAAEILVGFTESAEFREASKAAVTALIWSAGQGREPEPLPPDLAFDDPSIAAGVVGIDPAPWVV
jgi:hypothetical protein